MPIILALQIWDREMLAQISLDYIPVSLCAPLLGKKNRHSGILFVTQQDGKQEDPESKVTFGTLDLCLLFSQNSESGMKTFTLDLRLSGTTQ